MTKSKKKLSHYEGNNTFTVKCGVVMTGRQETIEMRRRLHRELCIICKYGQDINYPFLDAEKKIVKKIK